MFLCLVTSLLLHGEKDFAEKASCVQNCSVFNLFKKNEYNNGSFPNPRHQRAIWVTKRCPETMGRTPSRAHRRQFCPGLKSWQLRFGFSVTYFLLSSCAQWSGKNKNRDVSTGPLSRPFAHSLALLIHSLAPDCLLRSRPPLCSLVRSLAHFANFAHSLAHGKVNY